MKPSQAQRIRFGILAARHMLERGRMTPGQIEDLEGMRESGWRRDDARKAFDHEVSAAIWRSLHA